MAHKLKDEAQNYEPIPGIPWTPGIVLTDDEFARVSAQYDAQFDEAQKGSLDRWFEKITDAAPAAPDASPKKR